MRPLTKNSPFYLPLSQRTINSLFSRLWGPFTRGLSSTLIMGRNFGGGRALTKFMVMEMDLLAESAGIPISKDTYTVIYIDPYELEHATKQSFFRRVWYGLTGDASGRDVQISDLYDEVLKAALSRHVVLIIRGANYVSFSDREFWENVRSIMAYPEHVHLMLIVYEGGRISLRDSQFDPIRPILNQNKVRLDTLSREDVEYSIERWGYTLEYTFGIREKNEIRRISEGKPALLKACCFAAADSADIPIARHPLVLDVQKRRQSHWVHPVSLSKVLSRRERKLYKYFKYRAGLVVTRDEIASIMWGGEAGNRYSEAAITRTISRIRSKMSKIPEVKGKIETKYGEGYVYQDR